MEAHEKQEHDDDEWVEDKNCTEVNSLIPNIRDHTPRICKQLMGSIN